MSHEDQQPDDRQQTDDEPASVTAARQLAAEAHADPPPRRRMSQRRRREIRVRRAVRASRRPLIPPLGRPGPDRPFVQAPDEEPEVARWQLERSNPAGTGQDGTGPDERPAEDAHPSAEDRS